VTLYRTQTLTCLQFPTIAFFDNIGMLAVEDCLFEDVKEAGTFDLFNSPLYLHLGMPTGSIQVCEREP
jgi:hypothetical protein